MHFSVALLIILELCEPVDLCRKLALFICDRNQRLTCIAITCKLYDCSQRKIYGSVTTLHGGSKPVLSNTTIRLLAENYAQTFAYW